MCPNEFMGDFVIDEEGTTCNDIDLYIQVGLFNCTAEENVYYIEMGASLCCENYQMEPCNHFFNESKHFFLDIVFYPYCFTKR